MHCIILLLSHDRTINLGDRFPLSNTLYLTSIRNYATQCNFLNINNRPLWFLSAYSPHRQCIKYQKRSENCSEGILFTLLPQEWTDAHLLHKSIDVNEYLCRLRLDSGLRFGLSTTSQRFTWKTSIWSSTLRKVFHCPSATIKISIQYFCMFCDVTIQSWEIWF